MKKILGLALAAILVMAMVAGGTWAYFNDVEASDTNAITAGKLDITLGTSEYSTDIDNIKPGDTHTVTIDVTNAGTLPLDYTVEANLTGTLTAALTKVVKIDGTETLSGTLALAASDTIVVSLEFPDGTPLHDNPFQEATANLEVIVTAVQQ
jgi:predicted ribosomally synthesized peptide with SipW-like signal peptide